MNLRLKAQTLSKNSLVLYTPLDTSYMGILRQDCKKTFGLILFNSLLPDHKLQKCVQRNECNYICELYKQQSEHEKPH